jgi:hypothetical protein
MGENFANSVSGNNVKYTYKDGGTQVAICN